VGLPRGANILSLLAPYLARAGQSGTWKAKGSSADAHGFPQFGAAVAIDLIFLQKQSLILTDGGEEVRSEAQALVSEEVGIGDIITYGGIEYEVKAVQVPPPIINTDTIRKLFF